MHWKSITIVPVILVLIFTFLLGCDKNHKKIIVYSGQGLERVMQKITLDFEAKHGVEVETIYAGSETLLSTINRTRIGDVYIPGSLNFIGKAGELILEHKYVSRHVPSFVVRKDNPKNIYTIEDLLKPGIKIAIGNKKMCAIGKIADEIMQTSSKHDDFVQNISITGSTVNELLDLVLQKEVDVALVWRDMMAWPEAKDLRHVEIPQEMNKPKNIHIAVLTTTTDKETATLFTDFVTTEGKTFFVKNGFGE